MLNVKLQPFTAARASLRRERERATIERVIKQSNTPFADIGPERRQPRYIRDSLLLLRALSHYWPSEHLTVDPPTLHDYGRGVTATASEM